MMKILRFHDPGTDLPKFGLRVYRYIGIPVQAPPVPVKPKRRACLNAYPPASNEDPCRRLVGEVRNGVVLEALHRGVEPKSLTRFEFPFLQRGKTVNAVSWLHRRRFCNQELSNDISHHFALSYFTRFTFLYESFKEVGRKRTM